MGFARYTLTPLNSLQLQRSASPNTFEIREVELGEEVLEAVKVMLDLWEHLQRKKQAAFV